MPQPEISSLTVLGGPLDGSSFPIEFTFDEFMIGSDPDCDWPLDLPDISPIHVRLMVDGANVTVRDAGSVRGLFVNDERVLDQAALRDGDILWLGQPAEQGSVMLRCRLVARAAADPAEDPFYLPEDEPTPTAPLPAPVPAAPAAEVFFLDESFPPPSPGSRPAPPTSASAEAFFVEEPGPVAAPPPAARPGAPMEAFVLTEAGPPPPGVPPAPPIEVFGLSEAQPPVAARKPPAVPVPVPVPRPVVAARANPPATPVAAATAPTAKPVSPAPAPRAAVGPLPPLAPRAPRPSPGAAARPRPARPAPRPTPARSSRGLLIGLGALAVLLALGGGGFVAWQRLTTPRLTSLAPLRARIGQTVVLGGTNFAPTAAANTVMFGELPGTVVKASPQQLEVNVPDLPLAPGAEARVQVRVQRGSRSSEPVDLTIYQGPRLHGLSPDVAMPGETIELSGAGWGGNVKVRFGDQQAEVVETRADRLRVKVPDIQGPPGTSAPVTVEMGSAVSNAGPFFVGSLPLLLEVAPKSAAPGEIVTVSGRGLRPAIGTVGAAVGEKRALVLQSSGTEVRLIVPRAPAGSTLIRVALTASGQIGEIAFDVAALPDPIEFHFVPEPFDDDPSGEQVVLATQLGPAFVLSSSGGKSATQRAIEAQKRLNAAAVPLRASLEADLEARGFSTGKPVIGLKGKPEVLLEVTPEDAAAYDKDWTKLGAKAKPVTPGRLATWWAALGRDLVLVLIRNGNPVHAAGLAPEGRVLQDVYAAARKATHFGVPHALVAEAKPPLLAGLRTLALRVPPSVAEPAGVLDSGPAATAALKTFQLDGEWPGSENVPEGPRRIRVLFKGRNGTLFYESGFSVGFPLISVEQPQKGVVRFSAGVRGSVRYYQGKFDGQKLSGSISAEERGPSIGSFELRPR